MTTNKNEKKGKKEKKELVDLKIPYEYRVKNEISQILADQAQLELWKNAFPTHNINEQILKAQSWLLANQEKRKKNLKRFLVNWLTRAMEFNNIGSSRQVSPEFALKMRIEYDNNLKKLNDEKDTIEASLDASEGVAAKKRLYGDLQDVNRRIQALKSTQMGNQNEN